MTMTRIDGESYFEYAKRLSLAVQSGLISYDDWSEYLIGEQFYSTETLRRCFQFFIRYLNELENEEISNISDDAVVRSLQNAKQELITERKKLETVNLEAQSYYRHLGRNELFNEKIIEAIHNLPRIDLDYYSHDSKTYKPTKSTGLLCVADLHAGSTYQIYGLHNEIVNEYNFDIMKQRLLNLIDKIVVDDICADKYVIAILGDCFENILRISSLSKLREPVVDTVINLSEFLCQWLVRFHNKLQRPIQVITVGGNHDTISFLNSKPRLEEENLTKIVVKFMQERFKDIPEIEVNPYTDAAFANIEGVNILFEHGEGDLQQTVEFYSNLYDVTIDEIYSGHLHRPENKAIGLGAIGDKMIYRVGSICGIDGYSKKLRKSARPSAYFAIYNRENGHDWSKNYYL